MNIRCEHCGQIYEYDESWSGQTLSCKKCNQLISIPHEPHIIRLKKQTSKVGWDISIKIAAGIMLAFFILVLMAVGFKTLYWFSYLSP